VWSKLVQLRPIRISLAFGALVVAVCLCAFLVRPVLVPLILSFVLYGLLNPLGHFLTRLGLSQMASIIWALLGALAFGVSAAVFFVPSLIEQFAQLQAQLPQLWSAVARLERDAVGFLASFGIKLELDALMTSWMGTASGWGSSVLMASSNALLALTSYSLLIPIFTFFLLRDYRTFRNTLLDALPNRLFELGWIIYTQVARQLQSYVAGLILQSAIMATVTTFGFMMISMDNPMLLGLIAGLLNLIPYVGPVLAMVPPAVIALGMPSFEPSLVFGGVFVIVVGQLVDNLFTVPVVLAQSVALHPLVVMIGIIVFGNFFGLFGMMVAIPVISTANIILKGMNRGLGHI
jgi:putative permease